MITYTKETQEKLTPDNALQILKEGNARFIQKKREDRDYLKQVSITASGQAPYAAVLSCIDSRVPVEIVFDQGIGDLFSTRVAGNIINADVLGSIEYACKVAGSKLVLIMGHTSCGAVNAACQGVELGNITELLSKIQPAVNTIKGKVDNFNADHFNFVSTENVHHSAKSIREQSSILKEMEANGEIKILGATYDVGSGKVNFYEV